MGGLFLYKSFSSLEQTRCILISWKARGVKWWTGNGSETMDQLLTCSVVSLSCQRRPFWETKMKTCSSQLWLHGLASGKSIHKISDRLWFSDRSRLYLILNKNWRVHSLSKLIILMFFNISKQHLRAIINESQNPRISLHTISGWSKKFQRYKAESSLHQCKKTGVWSARIGIFRIRKVLH
jgi:hypothetical protein